MSTKTPITTSIVSVYISHILIVSVSRSLEFFSGLNEVFLSDGTPIFTSLQVLFLWPLIVIPSFLADISLSVCICIDGLFHFNNT